MGPASITDRIAGLPPDKRALLEQRLAARRGAAVVPSPIDESAFILSSAQRRMWALHQLDPKGNSLIVPLVLRLHGPLDVRALGASLALIARRHAVLRLTVDTVNGIPEPRLQADGLALEIIAATGPEQSEAAIARFIQRPFDLATGMARVGLLKLGATDHVLALAFHHMVFDGRSIAVLLGELNQAYGAFRGGAAPTLPPLAFAYADFARWESERLAEDGFAASRRVWLDRLDGAPSAVSFAGSAPETPPAKPFIQSVTVGTGTATYQRLKAFAAGEQLTPFAVLLATLAALIGRWCRIDDVVIGMESAAAVPARFDGLIGLFLNPLPIRVDLAGAPSLRQLSHRLRERLAEALTHGQYPFERLVADLKQSGRPQPLFNVVISLRNQSMDAFALDDLTVTPHPGGGSKDFAPQFDLALSLIDTGSIIGGAVEGDARVFGKVPLESFTRALEALLAAALDAPDQPIDRLPLRGSWMPPATLPSPAQTASFSALFEAACDRNPMAPALWFDGIETSYDALDRRTNRLARVLLAEGADRGTRVALFLDRNRGPDLVASVLAVLKTGAAFTVLDPRQASARHRAILEDAAPVFVIAADDPPLAGTWRVLDFDALEDRATASTDARLAPSVGADDAAYVVFTSGSTGRPKGVAATHGGLANLAAAQRAVFGLGPADRVVQFSAITFDAFAWDLAMAWSAGATLVLGAIDELAPGPDLATLLERSRTTAITIPPSALAILPPAPLPALQLLVVAGEPCPVALADRWAPHRRMVNAYGPTETTIWASFDEVRPGASPPIGRAIPGAALYLLDDHFMPLPIGAVGEICIGGAGVTRGYLNAPDTTAAVFVPDPFAPSAGARLYRSGDLGCCLPDGRVRYLGRRDDQVKIRGFRIEPGEVARALEALPDVARAHVAAIERRDGEPALVAWVELRSGADDPAALRQAASDVLPFYMRPSAYVPVASFPTTVHGKIDRKRLPAPDWGNGHITAASAPEGEAEIALAATWQQVLDLPTIGRQDDFFALGGDSILAVRAIARLRERGWDLKLTDLFAAPVLSDLAQRALRTGAAQNIDTPEADREQSVWPMTASQAGILFHHLRNPELGLYVQRFDLAIEGMLDPDAFRAAWSLLLTRHDALRGHIVWRDGEPCLAFAATVEPIFIVDDWRALEATAQDAAAATVLPALDLERPPLLAFALARTGETSWRLLWSVHHLITDGWSLSVLLDELRDAYRAVLAGEHPQWPDAPQYRTYLTWLSQRKQDAARDFWRANLAGMERPSRLAAADEGAASAGWSAETIALDETATLALQAIAVSHGLTLNTLVQGAWARVVQIWTGESDVVAGMVVAGRPPEIAGIERLVGLFVNTVTCRLRVPRTGTVGAWLGEVQTQLAATQQHGHLPLAELQRMMGLADADSLPFDALVAVQTFPVEAGHDDGITITARPQPARTDYPLTLLVEPGRELQIQAIADQRLLAPQTARILGRALATALRRLPEVLDRPIGEWTVTTPADLGTITAMSGNAAPLDRTRLLPDLIADTARQHGDLPALIAEEGTWSYRRLIEEADRIAHWLSQRGVGVEDTVALLADRSLALMAAMLGTWRAGAAFLPLGIDQPAGRLTAMVERARPTLLIAHKRHGDSAHALGIEVAWLDDPPWTASPCVAPAGPIHPASAAYVIFTSGSTGEPKGVVTPHVGILNRLLWGQRYRPIGPGDRVMQKTPYTFDVSVWEAFWPLLTGATLVIAKPGGHLDGDYLASLASRENVTVMHFVPAMLRLFLEEPQRAKRAQALRRIICSGEALPGDLRDKVYAFTEAELLNYYGPTEASIEVGHYAAKADEHDAAVPLGLPIDNARLYIVDRDFNPCPLHFPGELLIGGIAVGRGYVGRPDLTAERFVPDPFSPVSGARVYRTGDLARRRADGIIEFLGRLDWQVKIRGQRVEPDEVAAALKHIPGISEAVVIYQPEPNGGGRLVAYLTGEPRDTRALRQEAAALLPEAMIPSVFVFLDALPIGPSGKLDRNALSIPARVAPPEQRRLPRDALERLLAVEWRIILNRDDIDAEAHFIMDLGGHSLDALRLIGRLKQRWPEAVSLSDFLRAPSIAGVANLIRERAPKSGGAIPLVPGDGAPIILVHPAVGTVLCFIALAKALATQGPVWALEAPGFDGRVAAIADVETLARHHLAMLAPLLDGRAPILVGYSYGGLVAYEMARQMAASSVTLQRLVILDTPAPTLSGGTPPDDLDLLADIVHLLERYDGKPASITRAQLAALPPSERIAAAQAALIAARVLNGAIEALDLTALVAVARAAQIARSAYRPAPYTGAMTIVRAATPTTEDAAGISASLLADPEFGWRGLAHGEITAETVPGDHVSLILPPAVDAVAAILARLRQVP